MLDRARARDRPKTSLDLTENGSLARRKTHVACQSELASGAAGKAFNLRNGDLSRLAQTAQQPSKGTARGAANPRRFDGIVSDMSDIDMRQEEFFIGAGEDDHADVGVMLQRIEEVDQIAHQRRADQV